jgi:hypothetical protein
MKDESAKLDGRSERCERGNGCRVGVHGNTYVWRSHGSR